MVTLGVLLAFALSAWWQNRQEKQRIHTDLDNIHQELQHNYDALLSAYVHHQKIIYEIDSCPAQLVMQLRPPRTVDLAWQSSDQSQLRKRIDNDRYLRLLRIYQYNQVLNKHTTEASSVMTQINVMSPYLMAETLLQSPSKEQLDGFRLIRRKSWKPIFEDWVNYEVEQILEIRGYFRRYGGN